MVQELASERKWDFIQHLRGMPGISKNVRVRGNRKASRQIHDYAQKKSLCIVSSSSGELTLSYYLAIVSSVMPVFQGMGN
jgi:hypothetical protein